MFLYKVYAPAPPLQSFVANYSIVENAAPLTHHILMKAALVLSIKYKGSMKLTTEAEKVFDGFVSGLAGVQNKYRTMQKEANTGVLFINFTESGASAFFDLPLHELNNEGVSLDLMLPASQVARLEETVSLATTADERVRHAESFLISLLRPQDQDILLRAAISLIRESGGTIRMDALAQQLCISASRLEKRFRAGVGVSPKKFASMVRIETMLKSYRPGCSLTRFAYDSGYFDQAHFIRDIKQHTGMTPRQLFSSMAVIDGAAEQPCGFIYGSNLPPDVTDKL